MLKAALPGAAGGEPDPRRRQEGRRPAGPDAARDGRGDRPRATSRRTPRSAASRRARPAVHLPAHARVPAAHGDHDRRLVPVPGDRHRAPGELDHPAPADRADRAARRLGDRPQPAPPPQGQGLRPGHHRDQPVARRCGSRPRSTCASAVATRTLEARARPLRRGAGRHRWSGGCPATSAAIRRRLRRPQPDPPLPADRQGVRVPAADRPRHVDQGPLRRRARQPAARRGDRARWSSRSRCSCPAPWPSGHASTTTASPSPSPGRRTAHPTSWDAPRRPEVLNPAWRRTRPSSWPRRSCPWRRSAA